MKFFRVIGYALVGLVIGTIVSWIAGGVAHLVSAIITSGSILYLTSHWDFNQSQENIRFYGIQLVGQIGGVLIGIGAALFENSDDRDNEDPLCPKCQSRGSEVVRKYTEKYDTTRTETRRTEYFDREDNSTGYSETKYDVPDTDYRTKVVRGCKHCKNRWTPPYVYDSGGSLLVCTGVLLVIVMIGSIVRVSQSFTSESNIHLVSMVHMEQAQKIATPIPTPRILNPPVPRNEPSPIEEPRGDSQAQRHAGLFRLVGVAADDPDGGLIVRKEPSQGSSRAGILSRNADDIALVGEGRFNGSTLWIEVKVGSVSGWVAAQHLAPNDPSASEQLRRAAAAAATERDKQHQAELAENNARGVPDLSSGLSVVNACYVRSQMNRPFTFQLLIENGWTNYTLKPKETIFLTSNCAMNVRWQEGPRKRKTGFVCWTQPHYSFNGVNMSDLRQKAPTVILTMDDSGTVGFGEIRSQRRLP